MVRFWEWLRRSGPLAACLAIGLITADPQPARAQDTSNAAAVKELQRDSERLRQRVETLKRRPTTKPVPPEPTPPPKEQREEMAAPAAPSAEFGAIEATQEEVERALERALIQTGALLLPAGTAEIEPAFSYVRQEADAPVFLTEDGQQFIAEAEVRRDILTADLNLRFGLPLDAQIEVDVPYRYDAQSTVTRVGFAARQEESRDSSGLGDVGVTLAKSLLREHGWRPDLIGRVRWDTDTGETDDGLFFGNSFHEISGTVTAVKTQDPLVFVGDVSYETTLDKSGVDPGDEIGFSIGTLLAASPETSLRFFLNQTFADEVKVNSREIPGTEQVVGILSVAASSIVSARALVDVTAGVGLTEDAPNYLVSISLPFAL